MLNENLGTLLLLLSIYYADMPVEGQYPTDPSNLSSLTENGKYLTSILVPVVQQRHHHRPCHLPYSVPAPITARPPSSRPALDNPARAEGVYFYDLTMPTTWGQIYVYCTHMKAGTFWLSYISTAIIDVHASNKGCFVPNGRQYLIAFAYLSHIKAAGYATYFESLPGIQL